MKLRIAMCLGLLVVAGCSRKKAEEARDLPPPVAVPEPDKKAEPAAPHLDPLVERGAYVARLGACAVCHTAMGPNGPDLEHVYGGGLEMPDVIGTWRSPNITQDKGTGIGGWTDDQIARAIREGTRPDGVQLYPIMPFFNYNRMTDDDTKALVAFLRTVKPVERVVAPNTNLKMPKTAAPKPANQPDVTGDPIKHGEYVTTLMVCNHCHTGLDAHGAPDLGKQFAGGLKFELPALGTGTLYSSNITPDADTGIGKWTADQIASTVKTMVRPDGRQIQGPMLFMQASWSQVDDKDLQAVGAFVHQVPAIKNKVPASTFKPRAPAPGAAAGSGPPAVGSAASPGSAAPPSGPGSAASTPAGAAPAH